MSLAEMENNRSKLINIDIIQFIENRIDEQ